MHLLFSKACLEKILLGHFSRSYTVYIVILTLNIHIIADYGHTSPWVVPFQNCIRQVRVRCKMAAGGGHIRYMGQSRNHSPGV
jgi:hypothetical protein